MDKVRKRQILNSCNEVFFSIDKLDEFVINNDITIEEFKQYNLEIAKVKELERRKRQREGLPVENEPQATTTSSASASPFATNTTNSFDPFGSSSGSSIFDTSLNSIFQNTTVIPPPPTAATTIITPPPANKTTEIQKVINEEVGIEDIRDCLNRNLYSYDDLEAAGVDKKLINSFKHWQKQRPIKAFTVDELPPMDKGRTDVFFVGIPASGKSVMLSGLLFYAKKAGISIPDSYNTEGEKYDAQITSDLEKGILAKGTVSGSYNYIATSLKDEKNKTHPLNIVEVPGENYATIFENGLENDEVKDFVNHIKNNNRKILIFVLDALDHMKRLDADYHNDYNQSDIYISILNMFRKHRILEKTDAVYLVVNKFDLIKKKRIGTQQSDLTIADEFVKEEFRNLLNNCINAKESGNNKFKIKVFPFSIGEVVYDKILREYHPEYSKNIIAQILSDSFIVDEGGFLGKFLRRF